MWLNLKEGLFYFGVGGINRVEELTTHEKFTTKDKYNSALYSGLTRITLACESVEEIKNMLTGSTQNGTIIEEQTCCGSNCSND